ncbi:hypothetical protein KEH51_21880 [[Brevibacterium] frigoritolerans]|uniref:Squalene cyclase N-terminal domain-containing protein n=1 Tax=Peribacillus frigoritolerans TaxID=450367 RepID=A0A941FK69_9BACI|nr:hypothetical protein [Peribacillus frigoritolerans]
MNATTSFEYTYKRKRVFRGGKSLNQDVQSEINRLVHRLKQDQSADGSWNYPFDTRITADAYMIILLKILDMERYSSYRGFSKRIESKQTENGSWKLFQDEKDGNVTVTIEGLLWPSFADSNKNHPHMRKAKQFILSKGGIKQAKMLTKMMLTVTDNINGRAYSPFHSKWSYCLRPFFVSIYDLSVYGRVNMIPLLLLGHKKFQLTTPTRQV